MAGQWVIDDSPGQWVIDDEPVTAPIPRMEKIAKGMRDPFDGGAQLLTKLLPDSVVEAGNAANNWLADKTGLVAKLPAGGVDQQVREQESDYQAKRTAAGESGFDGYRTIGNVASPANLALAAKLPQAASLAGRVGVGVAGGAGTSVMNPVTDGDYWGEKGQQVALGGALGGATPLLTGAIGRTISPNASKNANLQLLKSEGVKPTVGQSLGGWANSLEEKMQSWPIMGDAIAAARQRGNDSLNKAAFNRALAPIGEKLPSGQALGGSAVEYTSAKLGQAYDDLLPKLTTQADATFGQSVSSLKAMVNQGALDPKYPKLFNKTLNDRVLSKFQGQNAMTGQTLKDTESFLTNEVKRFGMSQDPDARLLGDAYKQLQSDLRALVTRSNPQHADQLKAINTGWANFKRVQNAAAKVGADDGVFTPAQLQNAVRAMDKSKDKARFAEGNALMQDLGGAGKSLMSGKVPNSGTTDRLLLGGGALGSYLINPAIPAGLIAGAAAYSGPAQSLLRGAVSSRGQYAEPIAKALQKATPFLLPGSAQMGLGLLDY